jgi:hypothetical protein
MNNDLMTSSLGPLTQQPSKITTLQQTRFITMNHHLFVAIHLFFLQTSCVKGDILESNKLLERSALFSNALCLPLFDDCNFRSTVYGCENFETGSFDTCDGGFACVKTTERGVVCVSDTVEGKECSSSRDCSDG